LIIVVEAVVDEELGFAGVAGFGFIVWPHYSSLFSISFSRII
jgi:hypothetical protein